MIDGRFAGISLLIEGILGDGEKLVMPYSPEAMEAIAKQGIA